MSLLRSIYTRVLLCLALLISLSAFSCKDNRSDVSQELIDAFSGSCTSRGFWTDAALFHTNSLVGVLESLKDKDPCKPFADTLTNIQALEKQLYFMLNNTAYKEYRYAEETIQEISLELNRPETQSDPALTAVLTQALVDAKATLASKKAAFSVDKFNESTALLAQTIGSMTMRARDLSACMQRNPGAALQLATNTLALGGSFVTPVLGAGLISVGALMNGAFEFARHNATNEAIWKLHSSKMPLALTCGLEAMTKLYCQASDAYSIVELQLEHERPAAGKASDLWSSLDILGRRMPVLNKWLMKVRAGVKASNPNESKRQNQVWEKVHVIEKTGRQFDGELGQLTQLYEAGKNSPETQYDQVKQFIMMRSGELASYCTGNCGDMVFPFAELSTDPYEYSCWLAFGRAESKTRCPKREQTDTFEAYVNKVLTGVKLDELVLGKQLERNWEVIYLAARSKADIEFAETITVDPASLLDLAFREPPDNISPRQILSRIVEFLEDMIRRNPGSNPHRIPLAESTLKTVQTVITVLDGANPRPDGRKLDPDERVAILFNELGLRNGARVFVERLTNLASADLRERLRDGEFPQEISEVLRTAGMDIHDRLLASGVYHRGSVIRDITQAQSQIESNVKIFREFFRPSFSRAIHELDRKIRESGEPVLGAHRPNGQTLATLCTLLLSTGKLPDKKSAKICARARLTSIYADPSDPNDPLNLRVVDVWRQIKDKPMLDRMCTYYRYLRAERLTEVVKNTKMPDRPSFLWPEWLRNLTVSPLLKF